MIIRCAAFGCPCNNYSDSELKSWFNFPHISNNLIQIADAAREIPTMTSPVILKADKTLFVDCDFTLIMWDENKTTWKPHNAHINLIKRFHARGQKVVVWSAGGWEWASKVVSELKLETYVSLIMAKPEWWVDDLPAEEVLLKSGHIYLKDE